MPDDNELLSMEARLKDYISNNLKTIEGNLRSFSDVSKRKFAEQAKSTTTAEKAMTGLKNGVVSAATRFGPAAIATGILTASIFKLRNAAIRCSESFIAFEHQMSRIKAVTRPTRDETQMLSNAMEHYGRTTVFTAVQAGEALVNMGKLGVDAANSLRALPDVLNLAAGTEEDLAISSETLIATLRQFQMNSDQSTRAADVMAESFMTSGLNLNRFAEGMKYAGPVAHHMGMSLETATAALSTLSQQYIVGSQAGTGLRFTISELGQEHSKVGKILGKESVRNDTFVQKLKKLRDMNMSAGEVMRIFGKRAGTAATILINGADAVEKYTDKLNDADGSAEQMAETMLDDIKGALVLQKSAWEGASIAMGQALSSGKVSLIKTQTRWISFATQIIKRHEYELSVLAGVARETFKLLINLVGTTVTSFTVGFDILSTIYYTFMEEFSRSVYIILDKINWLSRIVRNKDVFDLTFWIKSIEEFEGQAQKSADNVAKAFYGMWDKIETKIPKKKKLPFIEDTSETETFLNELDEKLKQIIAVTARFEASKIELTMMGYQKRVALLKVSHKKEIDELADNLNAQAILRKAHENELLILERNHRIKINEVMYEMDMMEVAALQEKEENKIQIVKKYHNRYAQISDAINSYTLSGRLYTINEQINNETTLWKYYSDTGVISQKQFEDMKTRITQEGSQRRKQIFVSEASKAGSALTGMLSSWQSYLSTKRNAEYQSEIERIKNMELSKKKEEKLLKAAEAQNREKAKAEQKLGISMALINGAVAVTRAFAEAGPVLGLFYASMITATTALQIAKIKSQKLAKGGRVNTFLGEQGMEYVEGYGTVRAPSYHSLPTGTRVYNNTETKNMMGGNTFILLLPPGTPVDGAAVDKVNELAMFLGDALVIANREGRLDNYKSMR